MTSRDRVLMAMTTGATTRKSAERILEEYERDAVARAERAEAALRTLIARLSGAVVQARAALDDNGGE